MDHKICRDCGDSKPATIENFSRSKAQADGLMPRCKICMSARWKRHYQDNREHYVRRAITQVKKRRAETPEYDRRLAREAKRRSHAEPGKYAEHLARSRLWCRLNPERAKSFKHASPAAKRYRAAIRFARKLHATPAWANHDAIRAFYEEAHRLTEQTGIPHEVDHIIPLAGRVVCGLHVESNLQVVTAEYNRSKGNKFVDTS